MNSIYKFNLLIAITATMVMAGCDRGDKRDNKFSVSENIDSISTAINTHQSNLEISRKLCAMDKDDKKDNSDMCKTFIEEERVIYDLEQKLEKIKSKASPSEIKISADISEKNKNDHEAKQFELAKDAVKYLLKDPSSAEFRNLIMHDWVVCGEINSKNSFGGYVGFRKFGWSVAYGAAIHEDSDIGWSTYRNFCDR